MARTVEEKEPFVHPWKATHGNNLDQLLRDHGWKIAHRPPGREAVWEKDGDLLVQSQALKTISNKDVRAALCGEVMV